MPVILSSELYNGEGYLKANAGDWIESEMTFAIFIR